MILYVILRRNSANEWEFSYSTADDGHIVVEERVIHDAYHWGNRVLRIEHDPVTLASSATVIVEGTPSPRPA